MPWGIEKMNIENNGGRSLRFRNYSQKGMFKSMGGGFLRCNLPDPEKSD
jgi:hypothetical protein